MNLKELRGSESQESLAHRAGITMNSYARIERGEQTPSTATVKAIANALELNFLTVLDAIESQEASA